MVRNERPKELVFHGLVRCSERRCNSIALSFVFVVQAAANVMPSTMRPNPSVEGTRNIRLRLLSHAPHVKR